MHGAKIKRVILFPVQRCQRIPRREVPGRRYITPKAIVYREIIIHTPARKEQVLSPLFTEGSRYVSTVARCSIF